MGKIRTQIQLEENEYEWLKREAYRRRVSVSAIVRDSIARISKLKKSQSSINISKAMAFVGKGRCEKKDVSLHHDDYLAGIKE